MHEPRSVVTDFGGLKFQVALAASTIRILKMPTETLLASDALNAKLSPAACAGKNSSGEICYKVNIIFLFSLELKESRRSGVDGISLDIDSL
jgi:hypothetical protein